MVTILNQLKKGSMPIANRQADPRDYVCTFQKIFYSIFTIFSLILGSRCWRCDVIESLAFTDKEAIQDQKNISIQTIEISVVNLTNICNLTSSFL